MTSSDDPRKLPDPREPSGDHLVFHRQAPGMLVDGPNTDAAGGGHGVTAADEDPRGSHRKRHSRRTALGVLAAAVVASAAGLAATGVLGGSEDKKAQTPAGPSATAKVQRTTLTDTQKVDGKLGYGDVSSVVSSGSSQGLVTWVPKSGDVIQRGGNVYSVNQKKTPLLYGNIPIYRTLQPGDSGSDVKILEENLKALGYYDYTVDSYYGDAVAAAVKEWQGDLNRDKTGTVKPGEAVVADGSRKVSDVKAQVGAPPSGPVLSWTGTGRIITVDLDAQYENLVSIGTTAQIELPDKSTVEATVTDIGSPTSPSTVSDSTKKTTLPIKLAVKDQKGLGKFEASTVTVVLKSKARNNVLAVPISALVARNGGGSFLGVVKPSAPNGVEYVPVELGLFAQSMVEVSGPGITEGTVVEVPK